MKRKRVRLKTIGYVVYCHTNGNNAKKYVGLTSIYEGFSPIQAMTRRWTTHLQSVRRGKEDTLFIRAIRKHGIDVWDHEVLEVMSTVKGVKRAEVLWIAQRKSFAFDPDGWGYNMTRGGDGFLGMPKTPIWKKRISESNSGARAANARPVTCITDGKTFPTIRNAARFYGVLEDAVKTRCYGRRISLVQGLDFRFTFSSQIDEYIAALVDGSVAIDC